MTLPRTIEGKEQAKFVNCPEGSNDVAVRTTICQSDGDTIKVEFSTEGEPLNSYSELLSLGGLATATLVLYTVPVGKKFNLSRIDFSGTNKAEYKIDVNNQIQAKKRTWYTQYNNEIIFNDLPLAEGDIVKLIVENKTNSIADFNANIQGRVTDA